MLEATALPTEPQPALPVSFFLIEFVASLVT